SPSAIYSLSLHDALPILAPTVGWLFLGRVLSGITASSFSTSFAYIADVTPPDERAGRFGLLGMAFGVGFILGPAVGGLLGGIGRSEEHTSELQSPDHLVC